MHINKVLQTTCNGVWNENVLISVTSVRVESWCWEKYWTCVIFSSGGGKLERGRRFHSSPDALQQGEECVPVICAVDVGCISLQQLMKAIGHLPADPGQHVRFHHQQETQGQENLWVHRERRSHVGTFMDLLSILYILQFYSHFCRF